jgi:hypothetical protein
MKKLLHGLLLTSLLTALAGAQVSYKVGTLFHISGLDTVATSSYFRGYGIVSVDLANFYLKTRLDCNYKSGSGNPPSLTLKDAYFGAKLKEELIDIWVGHGSFSSAYGYYFRPTYAGSPAPFNPLIIADGLAIAINPEAPVGFSVGTDLNYDDSIPQVLDVFATMSLDLDIDKDAGTGFSGSLEYYLNNPRTSISHTLFLGLKMTIQKNYLVFAQFEADDVSKFANTGHSALGVELKNLLKTDIFSLSRIRLEGYVPFSSLMGKYGIYGDLKISLGKIYLMPIVAKRFSFSTNPRGSDESEPTVWAFRAGFDYAF